MSNFSPLASEIVLKKMDLTDIPEILSNLKRDWPHSIHTYYFLLNFMNWTKQNWNGEFDFYCPNKDAMTDSVMAVAKFKDGYTFVNYHCVDDHSCKNLHDAIRNTDVLNWNELLIFEAIHERFVPDLQKIIQTRCLRVVKNDKCCQVWLPPTRAETVSVELKSELYFKPLDESQVETINKNWGYSGPGTEVIVRNSLTLNGGLRLQLRKNDSFVGWSVEQHYGGIGMLFVRPEFRRRGYAEALVKRMVRRAIEREIDPFGIIEERNNQSRKLFEKLDFENICMVHWIGVQK